VSLKYLLIAFLVGLALGRSGVSAQVVERIFGTLLGSDATAQKIVVTSDGYLRVSLK
jgi:hypothetical protein